MSLLNNKIKIKYKKKRHPKLTCIAVPDGLWSINELTEEELRNLHFELDYEHKEERWWEYEPLKILDLSCNSLTVIDNKIQFLTDLNTLDVCIKYLLLFVIANYILYTNIQYIYFIISTNATHL